MRCRTDIRRFAFLAVLLVLFGGEQSRADSTSPRLAAYYDRKMLLCDQTAYQWRGEETPRPVAENIVQVGVGRSSSYVLTNAGRLLTWNADSAEKREILDRVDWFAAGRSGVFASRSNDSFIYIAREGSLFGAGDLAAPEKIGTGVAAASIGDSADYFVAPDGTLYVKGLAHRGQYGDGRLQETADFAPVARGVVAVKAHTGHAIMLKKDGSVMGTGGNIYGPLGRHGLGDKAITWGLIFDRAEAIATGSSHSLALRRGGALWHWGRDIGLDPSKVLDDVVAAAADQQGSIALLTDGSLWQWERGQTPKRHFRCP